MGEFRSGLIYFEIKINDIKIAVKIVSTLTCRTLFQIVLYIDVLVQCYRYYIMLIIYFDLCKYYIYVTFFV